MALPPSTANWHWKNKNVTRWGTEWFERELVTVTVNGDKEGEVVSVSKVTEVDGDIELGQRKSKLITIYDIKVVLDWSGTASDGTQVNGTLTIPEVSHEITLDGLSDYVYNWTLSTSRSPAVEALYGVAKSGLTAALEVKFNEFAAALVDTHGKDLTVSGDPSRAATPAPAGNATAASSSAPVQPKKVEPKSLNTKTVTVEANFQAAAADLYSLLTDEKKIPIWTRAPAQSVAEAGAEYSLFGGGVKGKYVSLSPREIVQTWALQSPTWPTGTPTSIASKAQASLTVAHFAHLTGHVGTLTTTLEQSTDSTHVKFSLVGVPTGIEEEIKRNLEGY
ncbi:hypothetical protein DXG03_001921 [Asterophora parasitica]|uniref:Activator of Hsp90 ATPase AHSA1-like N-terminal domain-containing protein n=1 Tax=Asterophora parasitica TaxID=117018 RepID=A0A9P7G2V1_9AGAR|nr:hypothetical protein DXG03_001921 [Asterophora parasitica]